ncbi:hypothetical protein J40TS1_37140 [Paenibacillus montaniterrae]|uniref:Uncharacterized protein n=1 Tax=Paenibacillus montaniterrae TaxID=429341 RepID=A0A919YRU4_9BACL|nr:hypothetical protein [Paenibacillus montaniterrae]GIP18072.1 hypothetical protein J40TS1_37140 [Paenibacillus montaniterrae]
MKDVYGLLMFAVGFIGLILTYFLSSIAGRVGSQFGLYDDEWVPIVFYIISILLMVFGVVNDRRRDS